MELRLPCRAARSHSAGHAVPPNRERGTCQLSEQPTVQRVREQNKHLSSVHLLSGSVGQGSASR